MVSFDKRFVIVTIFFLYFPVKLTEFIHHSAVWKSCQKRVHCFSGKINISSIKSTFLLKKLLKSWFHGNFWEWLHFIVFYYGKFLYRLRWRWTKELRMIFKRYLIKYLYMEIYAYLPIYIYKFFVLSWNVCTFEFAFLSN